MLGWYNNITVNFIIPDHTKFICDLLFGKIKKTYRKQKVNSSENSGGVKICHNLLHNNSNFIINQKLDTIDVIELSEERKKYLYQKIRQYVEDPYKDIYYL